MNSSSKKLKVFIIDDDLAIRQCLKILLTSLYGDKFDIYSSGDGVEGLGMLYILNPDLIIIDTTLPTYSGRELIDYVTSNGRFTNTKLIVVDDRGNLVPGLNPNIKILSKQNPNFVKDLESNVREALGPGETKRGVIGKIKNFLIRKTLSWANRSDLVMFNISKHRKGGIFSFLKTFILFPFWFIAQIITSLGLAFLYLFTSGKIKDANIPQAVSDNKAFRVLAYPTLIGVLTAAVFFIIQIALFVAGGIVIFNSVRLESIFANNGGEVSLNFNTATYDSDLIELVEGRLRLKEQFTSVEVEDAPAEFTEEPTLDETVLNQPESETPTETQPEVIEPSEPLTQEGETEVVQPVENTGEESNGEVQGINDESDIVGVSAENVSVGYSITNPVITFNESIEFSNLVRIEESSSINTIAESTPDINSQDSKRKDVSIEALRDRIFPSNTVTYQLSPNNLDWYYFNANNIVENNVNAGWEKTEQGFVSSNTVQEVNQYLSNYLEVVGGNTLYLRIYLHSDGATQVSLNEIKVIREQSIITLLNEEVPNELDTEEDVASLPITFPTDEEEVVETVIPELPVPTIFQATYVNGNKVVYGKLLGASIPDSELQFIKVNVYYTSSTDITKTAEDKLEFIGESSLSRNELGDLTFLLQTPNREGGYVTAELVYVINNVEVTSILSKPLENSTFTVDSTADTADHTLNGICSVGTATGGACTLRAAIAEANNVAGADNIYFNIPTSDSGYRDYDTPDSPSSGDGVGGDDYWSIRAETIYPTISDTLVIDGSTQEASQGNMNIYGPDIQIISITGIVFTLSGPNSSVNAVNAVRIAGNGLAPAISVEAESVVITNIFGNTEAKGLARYTGSTGPSITIGSGGNNALIGNDITDGNVLASSGSYGALHLNCTSTPITGIKIRGNRIGMSKDTSTLLLPVAEHGIMIHALSSPNSCEVEIGGDSVNHRNYISAYARTIQFSSTAIWQAGIYNNYFNTDVTGTQMISKSSTGSGLSTWGIMIDGHDLTSNITIGAPGKGNLFRYSNTPIRIQGDRAVTIQNNTFADYGTPNLGDNSAIRIGSSTHIDNYNRIRVYNNFIGKSQSDPYFGLNVGNSTLPEGMNTWHGIENWGGSPEIKGNVISGVGGHGIYSQPTYNTTRTNSANYRVTRPEIGGHESFTGSLCNSTEQNCITQNAWSGIYSYDALPINETTLYSDNDFTGGNGADGEINIDIGWLGLFEIASSNYRRTDLSGTTINFPSNTRVRQSISPESTISSATTINITCLGTSGVSCPATGHTIGTLNNTYMVVPPGQTANVLSNTNLWFRITEYIIDGSGNKVNYDSFKFDQPHFSSSTFTFDGDSTDNVINTGTSRVIDTHTYTDRGEPWTDKPLATRNIATGDIGRFQIMEVEYVDANPILQEDGSYVITVDSTENIELWSTTSTWAFADDGTGTGSGGISKLGTTLLANGKTSLLEALHVSNSRSGFDHIEFSIASSDAGYVAASGDLHDYWLITSNLTSLTDPTGVFINGYSQPDSIRNTAPFGDTLNTILKIRVVTPTTGGVTLVNGGNNIHISGLNISTTRLGSGQILFANSSGNWIEGNIFGGNILGTMTSGGGSLFLNGTANNIVVGTDGNGMGDVGERNLFMGGVSQRGFVTTIGTLASTDITIAGNYFGVDRTGRVCSGGAVGQTALWFAGTGGQFDTNIRVGTNYDGISDAEESNIIACISADVRGLIYIPEGVADTLIQGNYIGTNTYGDVLSNFATPGIRLGFPGTGLQKLDNIHIEGNTISQNNGKGITVFNVLPVPEDLTFKNNLIHTNSSIEIDLNEDGITANDTGDSDTGPNNLMNYPEIHRVTYLSGGKYKVEGILDNNVSGEGPFDIEICLSDNHSSGHGGCTQSLGYFENVVNQVSGGLNPWSVEVTVSGDNGTQDHIFTSLATNALGSTSEFSENFNTATNPNFSLATYPITLVSPLNNEEVTDPSPILNWNDSGDLDLKHYEIYLNGSFYALVLANQSDLDIPAALPSGTYSWQVVGVRKDNTESGRSNTQTFIVPGEAIVSFPVVEPITPLPPVSFIPREDEIPTEGISSITQGTLLAVTLAIICMGLSAGAIVFIKRKTF